MNLQLAQRHRVLLRSWCRPDRFEAKLSKLFLNLIWVSNCVKLLERSLEMTKFIRHPNPSKALETQSVNTETGCPEVKLLPELESPICMEPLDATTRVKPCGHTFHFECIRSWLLAKIGNIKGCPCCRTTMNALKKIDKHGCCTSTHSVSRIRRESFINRLQAISEEGTSDPLMAQQG